MSMICKKCGFEVADGLFCQNCGWKQTDELSLEHVYKTWLRRRTRELSSTKGLEGYKNAWRILSPLKHKSVYEINLDDFQSIIDGEAHLSQSHQEKVQQLISQLCQQITLYDRLYPNYAKFLVLDGYASESYIPFTDAEIVLLMETAKACNQLGETARTILILIFTGWRPNELFNMKVNQVNILQRFFISGSKTKAGKNRAIPIAPVIYPFVASAVLSGHQDGYLLHSPNGKKINLQNWRNRRFYPCLQELGINPPDAPHRIKPYSCRHTFASLAYRAGVKPALLKKMIGHTNVEFTIEKYVHNEMRELSAETDKMVKYFNDFSEVCSF